VSDTDVIELLELLKVEIEWEYSIEYQIALDRAIEKMRKE